MNHACGRFSVMLQRPRKRGLHAAAGLLSLPPETAGWAWGLAEANCRTLALGGLGSSFSLSWSRGPGSTNPMVPQFPHLCSKHTPLPPMASSPRMRSRMKKYFSYEKKVLSLLPSVSDLYSLHCSGPARSPTMSP